jgi:ureidoglycolate lyase
MKALQQASTAVELVAEPLTAQAFAPFGQVIAGTGDGAERRPFLARMHNGRGQAQPNLTWMRIAPQPLPVTVAALERHPHSNQSFVPMNGTRQLVVVCPSGAGGEPLLPQARAFVASGSQGVNYDANVWHAPRVALCAPGEFAMFRWDDGGGEDTELIALQVPFLVTGVAA